MNVLDNHLYVERRIREADDTEARCRALVSQNMRRYQAIEQAVRRLRAVREMESKGTLDSLGLMLSELLTEIERDLETANQVRSTDPACEESS